jgi:hypothetical protein
LSFPQRLDKIAPMPKLKGAEVTRHSPGIVKIRFLPNVGIEASHAEEIIPAVVSTSQGLLHVRPLDSRA